RVRSESKRRKHRLSRRSVEHQSKLRRRAPTGAALCRRRQFPPRLRHQQRRAEGPADGISGGRQSCFCELAGTASAAAHFALCRQQCQLCAVSRYGERLSERERYVSQLSAFPSAAQRDLLGCFGNDWKVQLQLFLSCGWYRRSLQNAGG